MRRLLSLLLVGTALALNSGCATRAKADVMPGADLGRIKSVYVVTNPKDENRLDEIIQASLAARGLKVERGTDARPPQPADAMVTYVDTWMWDMTSYLLELTITVRDVHGYPLASGNSYRTSLARKSSSAMVDEVLGNIFAAQQAKNAQQK
jgi:hypothetical protein